MATDVPPEPSRPADAAPLTRTQRRAEANRQAVIAAARELIATGGVEALTLEAVAERADVAIATIYNRIGSRSALLIAVAEQAMEACRDYMDRAYAATGTAEERLGFAAAAYVTFARERPHEFRILVEPADEPEAVEPLAALTREQSHNLAEAIRAGIAGGSFRSDLDPDELADTMTASLNGLLALAWRPGSLRVAGDDLDRLIWTYLAMISDGVRTRPAPRKRR